MSIPDVPQYSLSVLQRSLFSHICLHRKNRNSQPTFSNGPYLSRVLVAIFFSAILGGLAGCSTPSPAPSWSTPQKTFLQPGDHLLALFHKGRERSYLLHIPPQVLSQQSLPVVLNFHGGRSHARQQQEYTNLDGLADQEGFYVVYPNGTGPLSSRLLTWNAGTCCGYAHKHRVDDVGFIRFLLTDLDHYVSIDQTRIYATGLSNGGMMAYRLAAEASDLVAAIAPVAGTMAIPRINPTYPVPVMHVHSLDDPRAPFDGGEAPLFPLTKQRVSHYPVEPQLRQWIRKNGCDQDPMKGPVLQGPSGTPEAFQTAQKISYLSCQTGTEVILWQLTGAGHVWPGGAPTPLQHFLGPASTLLPLNQEMWNFFARHRRIPR